MKLSTALFPWEREDNPRSEVSQAAKDLSVTDHGIERDCRVHEDVATWDSRGFVGEPQLKGCIRSLRESLVHPTIVIELFFLQGLDLFFRETSEQESSKVQKAVRDALGVQF